RVCASLARGRRDSATVECYNGGLSSNPAGHATRRGLCVGRTGGAVVVAFENIIPLLHQEPDHRALLDAIRRLKPGRVLEIDGPPTSARLAILAALIAEVSHPVLIVTGRLDSAEEVTAGLAEYLPDDRDPTLWPVSETLPYELLPVDRSVSALRVELLARLARREPVPIVAPARALTQLLSPPADVSAQSWHLAVGERLRSDAFVASLLDAGYEMVPVVQAPGEVGRRGGIIDVFPPVGDHALRIELFGDEIDSLRLIDPNTQRSVRRVEHYDILPPLEVSLAQRDAALSALRQMDTTTLRPEVAEEWERSFQRLERGQVTVGLELLAPLLVPDPASLLDYLTMGEHLLVVV